ncbi:hypothetical protein pEaSNUABM29_00236 [Erwinia phage pEa_SNUABM_29]|nr:hypothetical protein pEaSNUABM29_00236 [Erwinia phage pEa_SNUABM_29]
MTLVTRSWYPGLKKAAQITATDVYELVRAGREQLQTNPAYVEMPEGVENPEKPTYVDYEEWFAENHEFYDALKAAFGDDEDEGIEFDWNINLAMLWICGLRPHIDETEAGNVLTWRQSAAYNPELTFKEGYMAASVELQNMFFGERAYCQLSWLTVLEKLAVCHKLWRAEDAPEHMFVLEYAVVPNQPLLDA